MTASSASAFADEREEAIWLTGRLTELVGWANWLIDTADRAVPDLKSYLQPYVTALPRVGPGACAVTLSQEDRAVSVGVTRVEEVDRLGADLDGARLVIRDVNQALAAIEPATRRFVLSLRAASIHANARAALPWARSWEEWGSRKGGLARLQWAAHRLGDESPQGLAAFGPDWLASSSPAFVTALRGPAARSWVPTQTFLAHAEVLDLARRLEQAEAAAASAVKTSFATVRSAMVARALADIPLRRIRETVRDGRLRLGALERAGMATVADVLAYPYALDDLTGVGEHTAYQVYAAAEQLRQAVERDLAFRVDLDPSDGDTTRLVRDLCHWSTSALMLRRLSPAIDEARSALIRLRELPRRPDAFVGFFGLDPETDQSVRGELDAWSDWEARHKGFIEEARAGLAPRPTPDEAWADFRKRAADYYAWLGEIVGLTVDADIQAGQVPEEIAGAVRSLALDTSLVAASLRGYQEFGAKYALVQRHTIIGDEMGLGKTVQAIAAIAHAQAQGDSHSLVVCPASVLINWLREVPKHSRLRVHRLHGSDRHSGLVTWRRHGGVGVTTYGQLDTLRFQRSDRLAFLVADEAHYLKNQSTRRGMAVASVIPHADRVLFLTGTPLENRLEEFQSLVEYVQPDLMRTLVMSEAVVSARAFRDRIAPVYLRRNQVDVLTELPPRIDVDDWVELSRADRRAHDRAVIQGNFMALRRAAFLGDGVQSAKVERLVEVVAEAVETGRKIVVFSYVRDVLDVAAAALAKVAPVIGPLTGSTKPEDRQGLIDRFTDLPVPAVLVSQVEAGGVGTNIQAASVVVLCEPQVKPSTELQAVARVHRMGQVERVQVHRLLGSDSVDQRMLAILAEKQRAFDLYVRDSAAADAAPEAVDISERELAMRVIAEEQQLLAARLAQGLVEREESWSDSLEG
jgi:superfamily II DNA or RNA helicase